MLAILLALGIGLALTATLDVFDGGTSATNDDTGSGDDLPPDDMPPLETMTDGNDIIFDIAFRDDLESVLDDLVESGEITAAEGADAMGMVDLRSGVMHLDTGAGQDVVFGSPQNDTISGGADEDLIHGGTGDDLIKLGDDTDVYGVDYHALPRTPDDIVPFPVSEPIYGTEAELEGGNDTVQGGGGKDSIADGYGNDLLIGNTGDDFIISVDQDGLSPDTVEGGRGRDDLFVDEGDVVRTGAGSDFVQVDMWDSPEEGFQPVVIEDFDPEEDILSIEGNWSDLFYRTPDSPEDDTTIRTTVEDMADGTGAVVSVGGVPVVLVYGGQGMTFSDIVFST